VGAAEDCREPVLETGSALGSAAFGSRGAFRGFDAGVGVGCGGGGSALERMLEKAIGSAGLLGVCWACSLALLLPRGGGKIRTAGGGADSCLMVGPPIATPFCRAAGDAIGGRLGDAEMDDGRGGWACEMGERGGKVELTGEV
jgi:hypothetical protein